jgi:alpha-amylase
MCADYELTIYRGDTVKHTDETVWSDFQDNVITLCRKNNPTKVLDNNSYTIAEVYNYGIGGGKILILATKK